MTKKKRLGADLTPAVYDEFIAWCEAKGLGKGAAARSHKRGLTFGGVLPILSVEALVGPWGRALPFSFTRLGG